MKLSEQANVYTDLNALSHIKNQAGKNPHKALESVARQFEAIFIQQIFQSMRAASLGDGMFQSKEGDFYSELLDKQLSVNLAQTNSLGMADLIVEQLKDSLERVRSVETEQKFFTQKHQGLSDRSIGTKALGTSSGQSGEEPVPLTIKAQARGLETAVSMQNDFQFDTPAAFVHNLWPMAKKAASSLGLNPKFLLAQSALETGWGKKILRDSQGNSSHNLFNIKAGTNWTGPGVKVQALEFESGELRKQNSEFRVYSSFQHSFDDFVALLQQNKAYKNVLSAQTAEEFTNSLQTAGFATDPEYARKIMSILTGKRFTQAVDKIKETGTTTISSLDTIDLMGSVNEPLHHP